MLETGVIKFRKFTSETESKYPVLYGPLSAQDPNRTPSNVLLVCSVTIALARIMMATGATRVQIPRQRNREVTVRITFFRTQTFGKRKEIKRNVKLNFCVDTFRILLNELG